MCHKKNNWLIKRKVKGSNPTLIPGKGHEPEASRESSARVDHERDLGPTEADDPSLLFLLLPLGLRRVGEPTQATQRRSLDAAVQRVESSRANLH